MDHFEYPCTVSIFMITSWPPAAADSEDPDHGGGSRAAAVGFSPEIGAAIDNRARGANVTITCTRTIYIYACILYDVPRNFHRPRQLAVAPIIRTRPRHLRSHLRRSVYTTVTTIKRLLLSAIIDGPAVFLSGCCPSPFITPAWPLEG